MAHRTQLIGNVNETLTPWLLRKYYPKKKEERQTDNNEKKQLSAEDAYLEQLQKEATLPQYELFGDYAEMAQQVRAGRYSLHQDFRISVSFCSSATWCCGALAGP